MTSVPSVIRILTIDDHPLIRAGIAALVATESDMELIAEASSGREGIVKFREHLPDVTLMDIQMPEMNGIDTMITIRNDFPEARIIVLTTYVADTLVFRALKAGAQAYVMKSLVQKELMQTIRAVYAGRKTLSPEVAAQVAAHVSDETLTSREIEVLRLIAAGNANKQIAARLSTTEDTIKSHVRNILLKLGANDRTHAATIGAKRGIIEL